MNFPNVFSSEITQQLLQRINQLKPNSAPEWGKMWVAQMLAHCNVTYEMAFENKHTKPNFFMGFIFKVFIKKIVVGDKPYKRNSQTAPAFIIKENRDFEAERQRLITYLYRTQQHGIAFFEGKESLTFGKLSAGEWNTMFYKHLDHHLKQFGV